MKSIPQRLWHVDGEIVSVPAELVNKDGPLYARYRSAEIHKSWMLRQEEVLNHVFDLAFAIAPDALINACFARQLGIVDQGPYLSLGREIWQRYGWTKSDNVTQQDGLFVSKRSALGIELKLRAKSSPAQVLKYASLFVWEEMHSGVRENLGLLYVLENPADMTHWRQCGLCGPEIDSSLLDRVDIAALPKKVKDLIRMNGEAVASVLDRTILSSITWAELRRTCIDFCKDLDGDRPGDQTLIRLVEGFVAQIDEQVLSGSI